MKYDPSNLDSKKQLASSLLQKLNHCGFKRYEKDKKEVVYFIEIKGTNNIVLVYTSLSIYNGLPHYDYRDAIRVCSINTQTRKGVTKQKRVNRVGEVNDIVDRTYQRMRNAYREGLDAYNIRCKSCGATTFLSKKGNRVCSQVCWSKE